jgi:acetoacetyl-[acyl-carrier protein] synthase
LSVLPVITALGGISPAGRSACHHGFQRLVIDTLSGDQRQRTLRSLATLCGRDDPDALLAATLVRRLEGNLFDSSRVPLNVAASYGNAMTVTVRNLDLPSPLPPPSRPVFRPPDNCPVASIRPAGIRPAIIPGHCK